MVFFVSKNPSPNHIPKTHSQWIVLERFPTVGIVRTDLNFNILVTLLPKIFPDRTVPDFSRSPDFCAACARRRWRCCLSEGEARRWQFPINWFKIDTTNYLNIWTDSPAVLQLISHQSLTYLLCPNITNNDRTLNSRDWECATYSKALKLVKTLKSPTWRFATDN